MKKIIAALLGLIILTTACKKEHTTAPSFQPDTFLFGKYETNCTCNIVGIAFYLVADNHLYLENSYSNLYSKSSALPDSEYVQVKPLIDGFPPYLLSHANDTIGYAGYGYETMMNIVSVTGADTTKWCINPDTTKLPAEIRAYMQQMEHLWNSRLE